MVYICKWTYVQYSHENSRTILPCFQNLNMIFNVKCQTLSVITPTTQNSNIEKARKRFEYSTKNEKKTKKQKTISKSQINKKNIHEKLYHDQSIKQIKEKHNSKQEQLKHVFQMHYLYYHYHHQ